MTALLPCPFCKESANQFGYLYHSSDCWFAHIGHPIFYASDNPDAWNRRAPVVVDDTMVERALIAQRDALKIMPGRDSIDYNAAMRAALEAAIGKGEK